MSGLERAVHPCSEEYLKDESRMRGTAQSVFIPRTQEELIETARKLLAQSVPVTVQGARTGIVGAAVPAGGCVVSTEKLTGVRGICEHGGQSIASVLPGTRLSELACATRGCGKFFLPNPTETSATIAGAFACNAKGMNVCLHGDCASNTAWARVLLADGSILEVRRGEAVFDAAGCVLPDGRRLELGALPPQTAGHRGFPWIGQGTDLLDVFASSEGMLGIFLELGVLLKPEARERWGVMFFFRGTPGAVGFAQRAVELERSGALDGVRFAAAEFFHPSALELAGIYKAQISALKGIPDFPRNTDCAVYLELEGEDGAQVEQALFSLLELFAQQGGGEEDTWAGTGEREMEKFRLLRHAVPEAVNAEVDRLRASMPQAVKLAADYAAPERHMARILDMYQAGLEESGLTGVIFGHIFSSHFHVNLLPETPEQTDAAKALLDRWARRVLELGGVAAEENGVGKVKRALFCAAMPPERLAVMRAVKSFFDPKGLLNPGNML